MTRTQEEEQDNGTSLTEVDGVSVSVHTQQLSHDVRLLALKELLRVQEAYAATSPMKNRGVSAVRAQALREAVSILESASGWQPIETAPKDLAILLFEGVDGHLLPYPARGILPHIWVGNWWNGDTLNTPRWHGSLYSQPTHWMPLPAPPEAK